MSGVGALKDVKPYPLFKEDSKEFDPDFFEDMALKIPSYVIKQKGNYDLHQIVAQQFPSYQILILILKYICYGQEH